jgi:putative flippase GtrA
MSQSTLTAGPPGTTALPERHGRRRQLIEVVVPVYNEYHVLEASIRRLHQYLVETLPYPFRITIADNASTDGTGELAAYLDRAIVEVRAVRLDLKGRGRALRAVWSTSDADVVSYMDVDLSTDLAAFLPLVAPLLSGHSDLAIGSRLARAANVTRGPKREFISRTYNVLLRTTMAARFSDAQCGFKAGRTEVVQALLPLVADEEWFFDTELLLLAERTGLRIHEVPVDWVDDPDSRVDIKKTVTADLKGMWRVAKASLRSSAPPAPVRRRSVEMPVQASANPTASTASMASTLPTARVAEESHPLTSLPLRTFDAFSGSGRDGVDPLAETHYLEGPNPDGTFGKTYVPAIGGGTSGASATSAPRDTTYGASRGSASGGSASARQNDATHVQTPPAYQAPAQTALYDRVQAAEPPAGLRWQVPVFATIGVVSTIAYLLLYVLLSGATGPFLANAVALLVTAVANTAANRRFTFGVTGTRNALRDHVGGMAAFAIGLVLSTGVLAGVHLASGHPSQTTQLVALVAANALSTLVRFLLLRAWVFHPRHVASGPSSDQEQKVGRLS